MVRNKATKIRASAQALIFHYNLFLHETQFVSFFFFIVVVVPTFFAVN